MDEREKYVKLYSRLISPQSDQSIVNYFSDKLEKLLEEEYVNNQSIDFWKGFKKFIQIQERRLNLDRDMNILYDTLEEKLFDLQEPHKVLDILSWLDVKLTTITQPQQETKTDAPTKKELDLKDFFVNTNEPTIIEIQNKFKNSADKDLAMLIYRLTELELVEIIQRNKKKSRKHFISALTGQPNKDMSYINRVLQNYDTIIQNNNNGKTYEITDNNYISVKNKLNNILNPKVV